MDPSVMALLSGGAPDAGAPAADPGLPASIPDPQPHLAPDASAPSGDGAPKDEVGLLKLLLGKAHDYMAIPTVEPKEAHKMAKAVTIITDLLSGNQEMHDQVSGGNPAMRKALGSGG